MQRQTPARSDRPVRSARVLGRFRWFAALAALLPGFAAGGGTEPENADAPVAAPAYMLMQTSMGDVLLELDRARAPVTVANFEAYVSERAYDGTVFHRIVPGFVVQGGGFDRELRKRPTRGPIANEWRNGLRHRRATVAMARPESRPNGATNQFFINLSDNTPLDEPEGGVGYAVFGVVAAGMETVDRIASVRTTIREGMPSVPVEPVVIVRVRALDEAEAGRVARELEAPLADGDGEAEPG